MDKSYHTMKTETTQITDTKMVAADEGQPRPVLQ